MKRKINIVLKLAEGIEFYVVLIIALVGTFK